MGVALLAVLSTASHGQDNCASCGGTTFTEAANFLASKGFPPDEFVVLLAWQEAARNAPGDVVTGYHVAPRAGLETFDLYSNAEGRLLSDTDLVMLGVQPKNWNLAPIEQQTELPAPLAAGLAERPAPVSIARRVPPRGSVRLEPLDVAALLVEDAAAALASGKRANRVGVVRTLPEPVVVTEDSASVGSWRTLSDGSRLWAATIVSPDAHAIRLCLAELVMPPGAQVIVYNPYGPAEAYGPYAGLHAADEELWTASCFADAVTVECHVPEGADDAGLRLVIEELAHTYVGFEFMQWEKVGDCNLDLACYPDWGLTARGVGAFTLVAGTSQLRCTGTLIADADPDTDVPYFLTANHCVSSPAGAANMEVLWLYQTDECDGAPPSPFDVPRTTGGADFLAGIDNDTGNDFTLVRLRSAPPAGIPYIGWTTLPVPAGEAVTCIHHPSQSFKRISFGHSIDTGSPTLGGVPLKPYEDYIETLWDRIERGDAMDGGTTEGGSSGSPLLLADSQLIVGQLYGGYASCYRHQEPDYYGRFDRTLPVVQEWLAPGWDPKDVDKSGAIDAADIQLVVNALLGIRIGYNADVDGSGRADAVDLQLMVLAVLYSAE